MDHQFPALILSQLREMGTQLRTHKNDPEWRVVIEETGFKTGGDAIAHRLLSQGLEAATPSAAIFSEEQLHEISERPAQYWLMDPIDGTASWHGGFDGYVCQLAFIDNNLPVMGAIYWPEQDKLFSADDSGFYINGDRFVPKAGSGGISLIDNYPEPRGMAARLIEEMPELTYKECGSLGLKAVLALTGEADLFVKDTVFRDWDLAPAMAIAKHSGGVVLDLSGEPLTIGKSIEYGDGLIVSHDYGIAQKAMQAIKGQGD